LFDEPLASLDPELRAHLRQELTSLQRSLGVTSIYVTHDRDDATVVADRILHMRAGRIVDEAATHRGSAG
jgi:ABC-type sugar transport system ATPase subunit